MCGNNDGNTRTIELYILYRKHNRISTIQMPVIYILLNWRSYFDTSFSIYSQNLKYAL